MHTNVHTESGGTLTKPPLFDVVYRIPEASLKLARDDRQAGLWYKRERQRAEKGIRDQKKRIVVSVVFVYVYVYVYVYVCERRRA